MGSIITRAKRIRIARLWTQVVALIVLNLQFLNAIFSKLGFEGWRGTCAPVFFCHSCPWAAFGCPLGVIVNFSTLKIFPFITLGILGIVGTFAGRIVCGWLCPFGLLQDLLHKIPTKKYSIPHFLTYLKYLVLVVFVFAIPYFLPGKPLTFCDGCPSGTLESLIPWAFIGHWNVNSGLFGGFTPRFFIRMSILILILVFSVVVSRGFCRAFCPLGAIFGLFNKFSIFRFNLKIKSCSHCGGCAKNCPVGINPVDDMNDPECIRCFDCTSSKHIKIGTK